MKKKILVMLTAATLCVGMLPSTVLADVEQPTEDTTTETVMTMSSMSDETGDDVIVPASSEIEYEGDEVDVPEEESVIPETEPEPVDAEMESEITEYEETPDEVKTITVDGITYTYEDFCLWIYDSSGEKVADYSFDPDSRTDTYGEDGEILSYAAVPEEGQSDWIENALTYTDPESGSTYHLIPVSYFENNLLADDYEFDETEDCPLYYDAGAIVSYEADFEEEDFDITEVTKEGSYYSITVDEETSWYLRVQDNSTEYTPSQAAVYYVQTLAYEGDGSGKVVINLGNSNGLCGFADYSGHRTTDYPTDLRYTTETLDAYADENGSLTIHLPAEGDLSTTFTVVEGIDQDNPDVTIALGDCAAYPYTLVGWVNIATGEYYEAGADAEIDLDDQNVFYADWIATSYDHGSSDDPDVLETVSTSGFVTMHLYDFNEIFNMYSAKVVQNVGDDGTITETWSDSGTMYDTLMGANLGNGSKLTNSFIFVNDGASSASGNLGYVASQTAGNKWTGTGGYPRNAYEQWGITSPSSAPLNILFDQSESYYGVHYVGEGDYLFQYDDVNGYYYFNSDENTATYSQSDGRFYVYDGTQSVANVNFPCFLPFNDYYSTWGALNGTVDYWFGMDMTVDFYLSNAVGRGGNLVNGEHMVFNFSGDDDILIFIDGELVLDMSGIHDESFGSIDFTDGTVKLAMSEEDLESAEASSFSLGAGSHELEVYYMERGGRASNLEIQFNIMPVWDYESGAVQTVTAEKIWQNADGSVVTSTDDMPAVGVGLFDVVSAKTDDNPGYTVSGNTYTFEYTDDKNVYHKYEYTQSSGGDSLTYTEGDTTVTYSNTNSDGKVVDDDGLVIAWLEDGKLHLRIDEQTLSSDNDWAHAWELLDADGEYEALELSESSSYTTESASENLTIYQYWSIIGESEINSRVGSADDYPLILTEAAQEASASIGDTKEAYGWVIVGTTDGVKTTQVKFSQIATMETRTSANEDTKTYHGVYGVTSQSEIEALGSGAIWYMEDADKEARDIDGETSLEEFRLYCLLDGTKYYLALDQDQNSLMTSTDFGATFYYDALGELMVDITDDQGNSSSVRVEIQGDGTITIDVAEEEAALDDIRIYTLSETSTSGFAFAATNTLASTQVTVTKEWDDETFSQNRPDEITVQLYADGEACGDAVKLTESGGWTYTWENLPAYSYSDGTEAEIAYTVQEEDVTGYTTTYGEVTGDVENGYAVTITNATSMEKLSIQKVVSGSADTSEFTFEITLKVGEDAYDGDVEVTYSDGSTGTLTFADGTAEVTLHANETITLALPYGMTWEVTELTEGADAVVIYVNNEIEETASGTITGDTPVRFVNSYRGFFPIDEEIVPDYTDRTTWVKDEAVNEYNAIEIEMSTLLPIVTGYELENGSFTMNFHEVLDHELVLDEADSDFMVFIGGNQIDYRYYTVTLASSSAEPASIQPYSAGGAIDDGCSFHVDVDLSALYTDGMITEDDLQGNTEIIIFFFADLEGTGLNGTYKSTVWYEIYDGDELLYTSNEDVVYVYTYEIDILKYDASTLSGTDYEGSALAGATLGVYYDASCTDPVSRSGEAYNVTSGEDGRAVFYGLANGTYYVKETAAPDGYVLSNAVLTVVLSEELNDQEYAFNATFANTPEEEIITGPGPETGGGENPDTQTEPGPETSNPNLAGGSGTGDINMTYIWILLIIAAAVFVAAGVTLRTRRRVHK